MGAGTSGECSSCAFDLGGAELASSSAPRGRSLSPHSPALQVSKLDGAVVAKHAFFQGARGARSKPSDGSDKEHSIACACCLCWTLGGEQLDWDDGSRLGAFHEEVGSMLSLFSAQLLEDEATSGLILGLPLSSGEMGDADSIVRLAQLLCRWAATQSPSLALHVGVHIGGLQAIPLRNSSGRRSYFGAASAGARALAESSGKANMVHISPEVKAKLSGLRLLRVTLNPSGGSSFYVDPLTQAQPESATRSRAKPVGDSIALNFFQNIDAERDRAARMPLTEFRMLLERHSVDANKFGQGNAKTLQEFYDAVVKEEKSFLISTGDSLLRIVELVRISLRMKGSDQRLYELQIKSEQNAEGGERQRNQPLAVVLHKADKGKWQHAITRCFDLKFGLGEAQQARLFHLEADAYTFESENSFSETIPGIMTTYKRHGVVLSVKDQAARELQDIGLPHGGDFSTGSGKKLQNWTWARLVDNKEVELTGVLQKGGIDVSEFSWQAFSDLYEEVYEKGMSSLEIKDGELVRSVKIVKVWLHADILNLDHVLVLRSKRNMAESTEANPGRALTMRMSVDKTWHESVTEVLLSRLGITPQQQQDCLAIDQASYRIIEDIAISHSYPGLKTLYIMNEVNVSVLEPQNRRWRFIGLPGGSDFTFTRQETTKGGKSKLTVAHWSWEPAGDLEFSRMMVAQPSSAGQDGAVDRLFADASTTMQPAPSGMSMRALAKVVSPQPLQVRETDELLLSKLMLGRRTDWVRARKAANSILDEGYTSKMFYEDVSHAFPELRLYCVSRVDMERTAVGQGHKSVKQETHVSSGSRTSADDEYQRTIGALLAVYWLMRLHKDGKEGFCFGVDDNWKPRSGPNRDRDEADQKKRQAFYDLTDWAALHRLAVGAGLLSGPDGPHDADRTLAMLVLMSVHDIMKLDILLPIVGTHLESYRSYKRGEAILDHDVALSYVFDNCPEALPSYAGLSQKLQESVRFTHRDLDYNMGWLVQGEAPPGALFRSFREVIIAGNAAPSDIAFYFVHWFVDLAGAEPYPLNGCEKFVAKFPRKVLGCFIDSFSVVWTLGPSKTETMVYQDYLTWRWNTHEPTLGIAPTGKGSIAQMRLILMAQGDSHQLLQVFGALPSEDRAVLESELARTGCAGQEYIGDQPAVAGHGPALLVYYAPALLQKAGRKDLRGALVILAEVLRQARELWPLSDEDGYPDRTVIVRVDALKDLEVTELLYPPSGYGYVLMRSSGQDGLVKLMSVKNYKSLDWETHRILELGETKSRRLSGREFVTEASSFSGWRLSSRLGSRSRTNTSLTSNGFVN